MNGDHGAEEMNRYELESVQLTKEHTNWKRVRFGLTIERTHYKFQNHLLE